MNTAVKKILWKLLGRRGALHLKRWMVPRTLRRFPYERWPYTPVVQKILQPGDTVVDVGANIGYVSVLFANLVGKSGRVISVEPIPSTYDMMSHAVRKLGIAQIEPRCLAVSDSCGKAVMSIPAYDWGGDNYYEGRLVESEKSKPDAGVLAVEVEKTTIDKMLADKTGPIRMIKIDVEGHELPAIRGAFEVLEKHHPVLLIEVTGDPDDPDSDAAKLFRELAEREYKPYRLIHGQLKERQPGDKEEDYFFLREEHEKQLCVEGCKPSITFDPSFAKGFGGHGKASKGRLMTYLY